MSPKPNIRGLLEKELGNVHPNALEFILEACVAYSEGILPEHRKRYYNSRKWLERLAKQSKRTSAEIERLAMKSQRLSNDLRQAHISDIPIGALVGLSGPAEHFRRHIDTDPGAPVDRFRAILVETQRVLLDEIKFLESEALKTRPLWKSIPVAWWQKGTFEYLLERLLRDIFDQSEQQAHRLIIKIRHLLDGKTLKFDKDKKWCPAVSNAIARLSPSLKQQCHDILTDRLEIPIPFKR
jgi:hypothetical protein